MVEREEVLNSLLMRVKEKTEKAGLKFIIQKTKIMPSGPITSRQIGKKGKQQRILFSCAWKSLQMVTVAMNSKDAGSLVVKTNLDSILKRRDITLPAKTYIVKAIVFPVVMYGCERWTMKKAEHWRIDALNCGVGEDSWEFLGLQGDPTSPFWRSALGFLWKEWC